MNKLIPLVKTAASGEQQAFCSLIDLHRQSMYATALAITHNEQDALDAIQDTVLTLWQKLDSLQNPAYFKTWMTRILIHNCCTIMRKGSKELLTENLPEHAMEQENDTALDVAAAMQQLHGDDRLILQLFYFEDLTAKQIGEILDLSCGAVRMRLARGRRRFLQQYTEKTREVRYEK